jgi:hypothetical protein
MRIQDWFADHFGTQYAVPRVGNKGDPSRLLWFVVEFGRTALMFAGYLLALFLLLHRACRVQPGKMPAAILFGAALLASASGMLFCLLI